MDRDTSTRSTVTMRWAPEVLSALELDTLVSIDTTVGPSHATGARACAPRGKKPNIRLNVPSARSDRTDMSMYAFWSASPDDAGERFPRSSVLALCGGRQAFARHPGQVFPVVSDARRSVFLLTLRPTESDQDDFWCSRSAAAPIFVLRQIRCSSCRSRIENRRSRIADHRSRIRDRGSQIADHGSRITDRG